MLLLPAASVNAPAGTSIVTVPSADGVTVPLNPSFDEPQIPFGEKDPPLITRFV